MRVNFSDDAKTALFGGAYFVQLVVFWLSLQGGWYRISALCAVPVDGGIAWFQHLHLGFVGLLVFGAVAIAWRKARWHYVVSLVAGLAALPLQAHYVHQGKLGCDGP